MAFASVSQAEQSWESQASNLLIGKTIQEVRYFTEDEAISLGWVKRPLGIFLDDGSVIVPVHHDLTVPDPPSEGATLNIIYHKTTQTIPPIYI